MLHILAPWFNLPRPGFTEVQCYERNVSKGQRVLIKLVMILENIWAVPSITSKVSV